MNPAKKRNTGHSVFQRLLNYAKTHGEEFNLLLFRYGVEQLIIQYFPQYQFNTSELRMFPEDVVQRAKEKIANIDLPVGIDFKE